MCGIDDDISFVNDGFCGKVRDYDRNHATELKTLSNSSYSSTVKLKYDPTSKAVGGKTYRLYANVKSTNSYPVKMYGVWCP